MSPCSCKTDPVSVTLAAADTEHLGDKLVRHPKVVGLEPVATLQQPAGHPFLDRMETVAGYVLRELRRLRSTMCHRLASRSRTSAGRAASRRFFDYIVTPILLEARGHKAIFQTGLRRQKLCQR